MIKQSQQMNIVYIVPNGYAIICASYCYR